MCVRVCAQSHDINGRRGVAGGGAVGACSTTVAAHVEEREGQVRSNNERAS